MKKTVKKYVAGAFMVALFGIYAGYQGIAPAGGETGTVAVTSPGSITPESTGNLSTDTVSAATAVASTVNSPVQQTAPAPAVTPTPAPATKTQSGYADGVYIGSSVNAFYGNVQVKVTVSGGRVTDVTAIDLPSGHHESQQINSRAVPKLRSEVITAQNSSVNAVSGATYTSIAYKQSVASALAQA